MFEGLLTELSKQNAAPLLLQDYNYFINKAINQYINKRYNIYDTSQQTTDDLRVLKASASLEPVKQEQKYQSSTALGQKHTNIANINGAAYTVTLPKDYIHLLNCICIYRMDKTFKCYDKGSYVQFAAKKLTSDSWSQVINNYYLRPLPERPYFYITNINKQNNLPTNEFTEDGGTDQVIVPGNYVEFTVTGDRFTTETATVSRLTPLDGGNKVMMAAKAIAGEEVQLYTETSAGGKIYFRHGEYDWTLYNNSYGKIMFIKQGDSVPAKYQMSLLTKRTEHSLEYPRETTLDLSSLGASADVSIVEKPAYLRHANQTDVEMEIRYGKDDSVFKLVEVLVDYIKAPQYIRLTQEQVDLTEDTSQILEFPDYVCQEILNELVTIVMENVGDQRLQTHVAVSQSIAQPTQQQQQTT